MGNRFISFVLGAVAALVALGVIELIFIYAGSYDVGADKPHGPVLEWAFDTITMKSVKHHAAHLDPPPGVVSADVDFSNRAAGHYDEMCRVCHGAPGQKPAHWVALYPDAPRFDKGNVHAQWTTAEIFWIIKHGVKDTGMSAFGKHEGDDDLWRIAAFVPRLAHMAPAEYARLVRQYPAPKKEDEDGEANDGRG